MWFLVWLCFSLLWGLDVGCQVVMEGIYQRVHFHYFTDWVDSLSCESQFRRMYEVWWKTSSLRI